MSRPELGTKCTCAGCRVRFYDLSRSPAICPKCGVEQPPEQPRVARPARSTFGSRYQSRQPPTAIVADEDAEPVNTADATEEDEAPEPDDDDDADADAEIEIDPDLAKAAA
jgi:uncharacterized protein (TIGR02300 family)